MTGLPTSLDAALALLGELIHDERLRYGLATVAVILIGSGLLTWLLLGRRSAR